MVGSSQPSLGRAEKQAALFQAEKLRAGYGSNEVLHELDFAIQPSQVTVIMGPGGSGKTTLIRVLLRAERHFSLWWRGDLHRSPTKPGLCGMQQHKSSEQANACELFQDYKKRFAIHPTCLTYPIDVPEPNDKHQNIHKAFSFKNFLMILEEVPIYGSELLRQRNQPLHLLPKVLSQLFRFSLVVFWRCPWMIFDEPDADLEPAVHSWMIEKLIQLKGRHGIILATHNIHIARTVADYAILLIDGQICEAADASLFFLAPQKERTKYFIRMGS